MKKVSLSVAVLAVKLGYNIPGKIKLKYANHYKITMLHML